MRPSGGPKKAMASLFKPIMPKQHLQTTSSPTTTSQQQQPQKNNLMQHMNNVLHKAPHKMGQGKKCSTSFVCSSLFEATFSLFFISADDEVQHGGWMASKTPVREVAGPFQGNGEAHDRF